MPNMTTRTTSFTCMFPNHMNCSALIVSCVSSNDAQLTARWYSSWLLLFAYLPILLLYLVWLPLTVFEEVEAADIAINRDIVANHRRSFRHSGSITEHLHPTSHQSAPNELKRDSSQTGLVIEQPFRVSSSFSEQQQISGSLNEHHRVNGSISELQRSSGLPTGLVDDAI